MLQWKYERGASALEVPKEDATTFAGSSEDEDTSINFRGDAPPALQIGGGSANYAEKSRVTSKLLDIKQVLVSSALPKADKHWDKFVEAACINPPIADAKGAVEVFCGCSRLTRALGKMGFMATGVDRKKN